MIVFCDDLAMPSYIYYHFKSFSSPQRKSDALFDSVPRGFSAHKSVVK